MNATFFPLGPYGANCAVVWRGDGRALVVDPGSDGDAVARWLERRGLALSAVFLTHGHFDHISGVDALVALHPAPVFLHADDVPLAFSDFNHAQPGYSGMSRSPLLDTSLADGSAVPGWDGATVLHLPGHSPGSCALLFPEDGLLAAGDVLFAGSAGRTDLPGGSGAAMGRSLGRLAALPPGTRVICGHGDPTTIGDELKSNPFLRR